MLIRPSKYSVILFKIHSYRLLFRRFCPLGSGNYLSINTKENVFFLSPIIFLYVYHLDLFLLRVVHDTEFRL